ncbi:hypothetical protein RB4398 [Rhodopirellula baltica SH 1]|uniref:Uncharacterized protein n=1 Tax=Rhodopirellula baltica (strain DSM 10527 / NCIMB 13988 / SH1) TaxID=243090 RepID=Q7USN4_RHOBA|nr:hypothetical protein RB4398 [Rhodopirellula baltica SH 1]
MGCNLGSLQAGRSYQSGIVFQSFYTLHHETPKISV